MIYQFQVVAKKGIRVHGSPRTSYMTKRLPATPRLDYNPTLQPFDPPFERPTFAPNPRPSFDPSPRPTYAPTPKPTQEPTPYAPTSRPTFAPNPRPSFESSTRPNYAPTPRPNYAPTPRPTFAPSSMDPLRPTYNPNTRPKYEPQSEPMNGFTPRPAYGYQGSGSDSTRKDQRYLQLTESRFSNLRSWHLFLGTRTQSYLRVNHIPQMRQQI